MFEEKISKITRNTFTKGIEQQILQQERKAGIKIDVAQWVAQWDEKWLINVIRNARINKKFSIEIIADLVELSQERVKQILSEMGFE